MDPSVIVEGTSFRRSTTTAAPPSAVWSVWTNVASWPRWDTELREARLDPPAQLRANARGELVPMRGPASRFEVTAFEPERRYVLEIQLLFARLVIERIVEREGDGARFEHRVRFEGPLRWLFFWLLSKPFRAALPSVMDRVGALAAEVQS
ncbi:MAG: SRPBCC family protein [Myxococcales bacterium]|nr:SRPBCC family protein [Myxococcales bacterium]